MNDPCPYCGAIVDVSLRGRWYSCGDCERRQRDARSALAAVEAKHATERAPFEIGLARAYELRQP